MIAAHSPESDAASQSAAMERLKGSVTGLTRLPMLPVAATKALAIVKRPDCSLKTLAAVIETDPVLAAGILKLANSPLYRLGRTISRLDLAITRLGLRECTNLILTVGVRSLLLKPGDHHRKLRERLWQHSFLTACLCRKVNVAFGIGLEGEEFSAGLFHDLGRLLLAVSNPEAFDALMPPDYQEGPDILALEREHLGMDHCYAGAWLAQLNQLPASLSNASQFHHTPEEALDSQAIASLVAAADDMANYLQREMKTDGYDPNTNCGWRLLGLTAEENSLERTTALVPGLMAEALKEVEEAIGFKLV